MEERDRRVDSIVAQVTCGAELKGCPVVVGRASAML